MLYREKPEHLWGGTGRTALEPLHGYPAPPPNRPTAEGEFVEVSSREIVNERPARQRPARLLTRRPWFSLSCPGRGRMPLVLRNRLLEWPTA
jgi:hypothetical protein